MGAVTIALLILLVGYVGYRLARVLDDLRRFGRMMAAGLMCGFAAVASAMLEVAPQTKTDAAEIFDVDPGPITEREAVLDIVQIVLAAAEGNPAFSEGNPRVRNTAAFDLVADGLGPTTITKRGAGRFGSGFDFSLLRIFLVLLGTVVAGLALARWKFT